MFFFSRNNPLVVLALLAGVIVMFTIGADEVAYIIGGVCFVLLVLAILFDLWEPPKR